MSSIFTRIWSIMKITPRIFNITDISQKEKEQELLEKMEELVIYYPSKSNKSITMDY